MRGHSTRLRADRQQVNVILDAGLVAEVRRAAADAGVSVTAFVAEALEVALHGHVGDRSVGGVGVDSSGGGVGSVGGGVGERVPVAGAGGRDVKPDWDALLAAGVQARIAAASSAYAPLVDASVLHGVTDPLEEIA